MEKTSKNFKFLSGLTRQTSKKSNFLNFFCDFETVIYQDQHYVTCFSIANKDFSFVKSISLKDKQLSQASDDLLKLFLEVCRTIVLNNRKKSVQFFFHNFGKFDSFFILKLCTICLYNVDLFKKNNIYYSVKIPIKSDIDNFNSETSSTYFGLNSTNKKEKQLYLYFKDSYNILPLSLDILAKSFTNNSKGEFNHTNSLDDYTSVNSNLFIQRLEEYCLNDSKLLCEIYEKFTAIIEDNFNVNAHDKLTIASLAFKIFRLNYFNNKLNPIQFLPPKVENFVSQSYKGGYCDVFKPLLKNGYHYDVNSLYPYIMESNVFPGQIEKEIIISDTAAFNIDSFFGFIEVEVETPKDLYFPVLTYTVKKHGLIAPLGKWSSVYFSEEIKYALQFGYKFKYIKGYHFSKISPFKLYVNDIYQKRVNSNSKGLNLVYKLLLNTLYGRLGMKSIKSKTKFVTGEQLNHIALTREIIESKPVNNLFLVEFKEVNSSLRFLHELYQDKVLTDDDFFYFINIRKKNWFASDNKSLVHLGSAVTSYARIYMHKLYSSYNVVPYYTDTDSIICKNPFPPEIVSAKTLGLLRLESKITEAIFIAPKFYFERGVFYKEDKNNMIIKEPFENCKAKGFFKKSIQYKDYISLYEQSSITVNYKNFFYKDHATLDIFSLTGNIHSEGLFLKRKKIFNKNVWLDTKPLIIENETIK